MEDLLNFLYFGSLFDVKSDFVSTMLTRTHERGCCLTYDYVIDDATDLLGEKDLDSISALRGLLVSRPADSSFSHKSVLHCCVEHAKLWLAKSEQPIRPDADITVAALPMDEARATAFGLMKIDEEGRIIEFAEKPKGEQLKAMKASPYKMYYMLLFIWKLLPEQLLKNATFLF